MAQTYVKNYEPATAQSMDNVVRAQFIRPGDVSPEEYQRLLDEASRVKTYQDGSDYSTYSTSTYSSDTYTTAQPVETNSHYFDPAPVSASTSYAYDGRPSTTATTSAGYQIELFDAPIEASTMTTSSYPSYSSSTYSSGSTVSASHTVVRGDTLYSISKRFGVGLTDLKSANSIYGNTISIGQVLMLPIQRPQASVNNYAPSSARTTLVRNVEPVPFSGAYAVLPGDTLYSIARRACVSLNDITDLNRMGGSTTIVPGQRLTMPSGHCLQ